MRCNAWVGLEPPQSIDCELSVDHEGCHQGSTIGSVPNNEKGGYSNILVLIQWKERMDWRLEE